MDTLTPLQQLISKLSQRVYTSIGPGHNESIYQKALFYELYNYNIRCDMERHIDVSYTDTIGNTHHLVSERIDIFIHKNDKLDYEEIKESNIILELKALTRTVNRTEEVQVMKYFKELEKELTPITYGIVINFPQASSKNNLELIELKVINNNNN
tara:strand:+ start:10821 stop:11285 length:465 start_codon:yes stop_codon:yes gene_type:complete